MCTFMALSDVEIVMYDSLELYVLHNKTADSVMVHIVNVIIY